MPSTTAGTPWREPSHNDELDSVNDGKQAKEEAKPEQPFRKSAQATYYEDSDEGSQSNDSIKTSISRVTNRSMHSRLSTSSRARRLKCYRCLDFEALPSKPLLQCHQCQKSWHPMCCRPKVWNVKQYFSASRLTSYVCSSCANATIDTEKSKAKLPLEYRPHAQKTSVSEQSIFVESDRVETTLVPKAYVSQSESSELKESASKTPIEYTHPKLSSKKRLSPSEFDEQSRPATPNAIPTPSRTKFQRVFDTQQARATLHNTPKDTKTSKQLLESSHPSYHTSAKLVGSTQAFGALKVCIMRQDPDPIYTRASSPLINLKARVDCLRNPKKNAMIPPKTTFPSSLVKKTSEKNNMQTVQRSVNYKANKVANGTNTLQELKNGSRIRQFPILSKEVSLEEPWVNPFIRAGYTWEPNAKANAVEVKRRLLAAKWNSTALDAVLEKAQEEASITQPRKTKKQIWREDHMFHDLDPRLPSTNTRMSDKQLAEKMAIIAARPKRKDKGVFGVPFPEYVKAETRAEEKRKEEEAERDKYWWKYTESEPESGEEDAEIRWEQKRFFEEQLDHSTTRRSFQSSTK